MCSTLVERFESELRLCKQQYPDTRRWIIGLSGGLDSTALLSLARQTLPVNQLHAVYVDHQLQLASSDWTLHCEKLCDDLGVSFESIKVSPDSASEVDARHARYRAFESILVPGDMLLLAHQQDDQVETLLFRLLRGSGLSGLIGIPKTRACGEAHLYRPLLNTPRAELGSFLEEQNLGWIEDPSNADAKFTRNWIRHQLMPMLTTRWPSLIKSLSDTRLRLAEAAQLNRDLAVIDLPDPEVEGILPVDALRDLPLRRIKNALYFWLSEQNVQVGSGTQLEQLAMLIKDGGSSGDWFFKPYLISLFDAKLYLRSVEHCALTPQAVQPGISLDLGSGRLSWVKADTGFDSSCDLKVRSRGEGDRVSVPSRGGSVSIKKLMNEKRIPPWQRDSWPIIERDGQIVAIPGLWIDSGHLVADGFQPVWQHGCLSQT